MSTIPLNTNQLKSNMWKNKSFGILLLSGGIFTIGNKIYELALPLLLYELTHSSVAMATMRGIEFLPNLLFAIFIGVFVDRANKKKWSIWSVGLQTLALFILFIYVASGGKNLLFLYASGFLLMAFNYSYFNARFGLVKNSLPNEQLTAANASFSFIYTFIGIMGPALTGAILMFSGIHYSLLLTAISMSFGLMLLIFLPYKEELVKSKNANFKQEFMEGWQALRENKALWTITILVIFTNCTSGMVDATVIFFSKDVLHLNNYELGIALSASGIGGLLGSLVITPLRKHFKTGVLIILATLFIGFSYLLLGISSFGMLAFSLFLSSLFGSIQSICIWTYRQESTPHHLISRVSGLTGSLFKLGMPFAIWIAGWVTELSSPVYIFISAGVINIMIFLICRNSLLWKKE